MSGNQGTDTLGAIAAGGGRGTGRGRGNPQPNPSSGRGTGSTIPPQLGAQYQLPQPTYFSHPQYAPPPTFSPNTNYNYGSGIDHFLSQNIPQQDTRPQQIPQDTRPQQIPQDTRPMQQVSPLHTSLVTSSQTSGKASTDNKKVIELLVSLSNQIVVLKDNIKKIDERSKIMENYIRDINNNVITREYIAEVLRSLSKLPVQDDKHDALDDEDNNALDDAINKLNTDDVSDSNQDNQ